MYIGGRANPPSVAEARADWCTRLIKLGISTLAQPQPIMYTMTMTNNKLSSNYIASVIANRLEIERREREASRAARAAGAVFTNWCISDRD